MNKLNSQILEEIKKDVVLCLEEGTFLILITRKVGEENRFSVKNYRRGWNLDECAVILKAANEGLEKPQVTEEFTEQGKQMVFTIPVEVKLG
ncbi:MAG: hypothetical protein ABID54_00375 [Pseudomonadota bacterium]